LLFVVIFAYSGIVSVIPVMNAAYQVIAVNKSIGKKSTTVEASSIKD
jgi:hypothetical protein